ncbi:MAG: hypothetical protein IJU21_03880 [Bacteroidales bacterium]|nr:hypothetical protein [Bacteroidales bacterium]
MKRIFYLVAAVIGLCLTTSCGKDFFDQVLLEGNWGLTRFEMITSVNGEVKEDLITDCDPFNPKTEMDTQLAVRSSSSNYYEFSEYAWDRIRAAWSLVSRNNYIVRDNVLYLLENGREVEYGHFSANSSTLTIESIDIHESGVAGAIIRTSTVSRSTYRRLSEIL